MKKKLVHSFACFVLTVCVMGDLATAHEGHQPLPTKGVQVDTAHGSISLSRQARDAIGLESSEVTMGTVSSTLFAYAETVSPWQAKAFGSAQVSGQITQLFVRPGDTVVKNQVVAVLNSRDLELLRLDYKEAEQATAVNKQLLEMAKPSAQAGGVPMQRVLELENALQQSENSQEISRIRASTLGISLKELAQLSEGSIAYSIRSPIAGKIVHSDLSEGKFVEAYEHLYEIVNNDQVWVRLQLLEKDIFKISVGQQVEVEFSDLALRFTGLIDRVDVALDPETQVSWAWMTVTKSTVLPGLVGSAKIRVSYTDDRLCIPLDSVYSDGLQTYVFIEVASTKSVTECKKRKVKLGERTMLAGDSSQRLVEVLDGNIYPGDRVVVKGGHELSSLFFLNVLKLRESERSRLGIQTAVVSNAPIANTLRIAAQVTLPPQNRSVVSSQLSGTVLSHTMSPGRTIMKGELLMEIASSEFHSLQFELLRSSLDANLSRIRADRLDATGSEAVSRRLRLESLAKAEQLELRASSLRRQLVSLGLSADEVESIVTEKRVLSALPVRAAIDGNLVRWTGAIGKAIVANETLAEIHNADMIWIEAHVPTQDMHWIVEKSDGRAHLLSNHEVEFPVTVSRLGPVVDEVARTQKVYLIPNSLPQERRLRDGMQLSIDLKVREGELAITVPIQAILRDGLHSFAFVQMADGNIERRRVSTGRSDGELVEVLDGVQVGEHVIVAGGRELQTAFSSLR